MNAIVGAVFVDLEQEVVDEVDTVVVTLLQTQSQKLLSERLIEDHLFVVADLVHRHNVVMRIVDEGVAVDYVGHNLLLAVVAAVLGFEDQLFGDHLAGGTELGGDAIVGGVQVFIGLDGAVQL